MHDPGFSIGARVVRTRDACRRPGRGRARGAGFWDRRLPKRRD